MRRNRIRTTTAAAIFGAIAAGAPVAAQSENAGGAAARAREAESREAPLVVTLDFPGGTAAEYIQAVQNAIAQRAEGRLAPNIVSVTEATGRIRMPAVQLRGVDPWSALLLVGDLRVERGDVVTELEVEQIPTSPHASPIYRVAADEIRQPRVVSANMPPRETTRENERLSNVWSLADITTLGMNAEEALTAIEAALALAEEELPSDGAEGSAAPRRTQLRYHDATDLLIAVGPEEQIVLIHEVLAQLRETAQIREVMRREASNREEEEAARKREMEELQQQSERTRQELERWFTQELEARERRFQAEVDVYRRRMEELERALEAARERSGGDGGES